MLLTFPNIESIDRLVDDKENPLLFQPSLLFCLHSIFVVCFMNKNECRITGLSRIILHSDSERHLIIKIILQKLSLLLNCNQLLFPLPFYFIEKCTFIESSTHRTWWVYRVCHCINSTLFLLSIKLIFNFQNNIK